MKKIKNFLDKPITWGGYIKLCVGCMMATIVEILYIYHKLGVLKYLIPKRFRKPENNEEEEN